MSLRFTNVLAGGSVARWMMLAFWCTIWFGSNLRFPAPNTVHTGKNIYLSFMAETYNFVGLCEKLCFSVFVFSIICLVLVFHFSMLLLLILGWKSSTKRAIIVIDGKSFKNCVNSERIFWQLEVMNCFNSCPFWYSIIRNFFFEPQIWSERQHMRKKKESSILRFFCSTFHMNSLISSIGTCLRSRFVVVVCSLLHIQRFLSALYSLFFVFSFFTIFIIIFWILLKTW